MRSPSVKRAYASRRRGYSGALARGQIERNRRKNLILDGRTFDLFEFRQLHAGTQVDLVQDGLKLRVEETFALLGDSEGQAVQRGARNPARQEAVPYLVQEVEQLFTMVDPARVAIGGVLNALKRKDGVNRRDRAAARQSGGGFRIGNFFGSKTRPGSRRGAPHPFEGRYRIGFTRGFDFQALNPQLPFQVQPRSLGLKKS